jgi:hypothetical protein
MSRQDIKLGVMRSASAVVIVPIAGLLGGLFVGALRARSQGPDEIARIACVIKWGITGFFAGLALVLLLALSLRRQDVVSIRRLMGLVIIAGLIAWFFARVLSGVIGSAGF